MKRAFLVATSLLVFSTTTASAGGYLGLALGTEPGANDSMRLFARPTGRSLRVLGGARFGNVSIEGAVNGFGVGTNQGERTMYQASAALKLNLPLGNNFEAFGRAGLERTWLAIDDDRYSFTGNGFLAGAGFEYRFNAGVTSASLFVDYTIHRATLESLHDGIDATTRIWALGFLVAL